MVACINSNVTCDTLIPYTIYLYISHVSRHDVKVGPRPWDSGARDLGTLGLGTRNPPSKFKSVTRDPLQSLKVGPS